MNLVSFFILVVNYVPPVFIFSQMNNMTRLQNALLLQKNLPNSRIVQGVNGSNAMFTFNHYNVTVSPRFYNYHKKSFWGKMGRFASFIEAASQAAEHKYVLMIEDDVIYDKYVFDRIFQEVDSMNLSLEPPILRAGRWNECLVLNGLKMKSMLLSMSHDPIDSPDDKYIMKRKWDKSLRGKCKPYKWISTIDHVIYKNSKKAIINISEYNKNIFN